MQNAARVQLVNNEDIGWPEEEIVDDGEITRPDRGGMDFEKSRPRLVRFLSFLG